MLNEPVKPSRLLPPDALRGLVMVVMALDHANQFIARDKLAPELWAGPFPNYRGDGLAFLTRFVTHLAAPGFFFLMGVGMVMFAASRRERGWSYDRIVVHFLLRGALLILFQFLVENPAWRAGGVFDSTTVYVGVLYALGAAMIVGTPLLLLPTGWLVGLSLSLVVASQLLLPDVGRGGVQYPPLLRLWLVPGFTRRMLVLYPAMPWLGVLGLGMAYGRWLRGDRAGAYRGALWLGLTALLLFIPVRLLGSFGNIRPPRDAGWIAFLNVVKYPPSIAFLLLTLGGNLSLLGLMARAVLAADGGADVERPNQKPGGLDKLGFSLPLQALAVFGQVPLFFYVTHLYLYGYLGQWIDPNGIGIARMIPYWLLGLAILFPLCWLYGRFKHSRSPNSLWRFV